MTSPISRCYGMACMNVICANKESIVADDSVIHGDLSVLIGNDNLVFGNVDVLCGKNNMIYGSVLNRCKGEGNFITGVYPSNPEDASSFSSISIAMCMISDGRIWEGRTMREILNLQSRSFSNAEPILSRPEHEKTAEQLLHVMHPFFETEFIRNSNRQWLLEQIQPSSASIPQPPPGLEHAVTVIHSSSQSYPLVPYVNAQGDVTWLTGQGNNDGSARSIDQHGVYHQSEPVLPPPLTPRNDDTPLQTWIERTPEASVARYPGPSHDTSFMRVRHAVSPAQTEDPVRNPQESTPRYSSRPTPQAMLRYGGQWLPDYFIRPAEDRSTETTKVIRTILCDPFEEEIPESEKGRCCICMENHISVFTDCGHCFCRQCVVRVMGSSTDPSVFKCAKCNHSVAEIHRLFP